MFSIHQQDLIKSHFLKDVKNALLNIDISFKEIMRAYLGQVVNQSFKLNLHKFFDALRLLMNLIIIV